MSTPTPKKKGRKSTTPIPDDDRVALSREKFIKEHRPKGRLPNLDNVKAAVEEVWKEICEIIVRLQEYEMSDKGKKMETIESFGRQAYEVVKTCHQNGCVQFVTYPRYREMQFDVTPLIEVPPELSIFDPPRYEPGGLIDYESFLEKSFLLNDDVLVIFLCNLKVHLATVKQNWLDMEEWLIKGQSNKTFIETTFGVGCIDKAKEFSEDHRMCVNCGCHYKMHVSRPGEYSMRRYCDKGGTQYKTSQAIILKELNTSSKVVDSFDISDENEQKRLLKLMEYLNIN